jgi:hypothetical protein
MNDHDPLENLFDLETCFGGSPRLAGTGRLGETVLCLGRDTVIELTAVDDFV